MTRAEESAVAEVRQILDLHFAAFVLTVRSADEDQTDRVNSLWHGTLSDVIGLTHITAIRLNQVAVARTAPP